jgi:hypothetical protein
MILCESDITTRNQKKKQGFLENYQRVRKKLSEVEAKDKLRNFQPPLDGKAIMDLFKLPPGPQIGQLKNAVKDAILDGEIENNYQEAYDYVLRKAQELGLKPNK